MNQVIILDNAFDKVISSHYLTARINYSFAIEHLEPLINRLDFQRRIVDAKFYERLKEDILNGCVMPQITIAFSNTELKQMIERKLGDYQELSKVIFDNISEAFILDGIQRLNTLTSIDKNSLDLDTPIYANIIFSDSMNKLLYRMVILNNGQKPMSPRHQIEILMRNDLGDLLPRLKEIGIVVSEKEQKKYSRDSNIKEADLIKGYLAFVTKSVNIDNQKIIESKLDEIITGQIISSEIQNYKYEFSTIVDVILKMVFDEKLEDSSFKFVDWIKNENNLIGFCSGVSKNPNFIEQNHDINSILEVIELCETGLKFLNVSKFKVSNMRRLLAEWIITSFDEIKEDMDLDRIINSISQI